MLEASIRVIVVSASHSLQHRSTVTPCMSSGSNGSVCCCVVAMCFPNGLASSGTAIRSLVCLVADVTNSLQKAFGVQRWIFDHRFNLQQCCFYFCCILFQRQHLISVTPFTVRIPSHVAAELRRVHLVSLNTHGFPIAKYQ